MKKIFKITMSKGEPLFFDQEVVNSILSSNNQLLRVKDCIINKAHIVRIDYDSQATQDENRKEFKPNLPENPISVDKVKELKDKARKLVAGLSVAVLLFFFLPSSIFAKTRYVITIKATNPVKADSTDGKLRAIRSREGGSSGSLSKKDTGSKTSKNLEATRATSDYIENLFRSKFGADADTAIAICKTESIWTPQRGWNPDAVGDSHLTYMVDGVEYGKSYGLCQIRHLPGRPSPAELMNPEFNIEYAYNLYSRSGFNPWSVYKSGTYKRNL